VAVVALENVSKRYPNSDELAVDSINLAIADGEFVVLLGPSGCGKSTALRMIAGLESITSGTLRIGDKVMNSIPAKDRNIAMVFQSYALYPHMSVADNLAFGLRRRSVPRDEIRRRVTEVAATLGLTEYLSRKPYALSGGQRQRVALGRAIVRDPEVFLFDEPLSNLDAALRVSTRNELVRQHQRLGATMLYVTHDQVEAMTMGERICIMNKGRLVQVGDPLEVYRYPAETFVARFLGNPPMNLFPALLEAMDAGVGVRVGGGNLLRLPNVDPAALAGSVGQTVIFGIRPEDLYERTPGHLEGEPAVSFEAKVSAVEALGAETLLILEIEGVEDVFRARLGRDSRARIGDRVKIFMDTHAVHLFDPESTKAIVHGRA
jgi:multiple sugar transport system ATP-binding protein